MKEKDIEQYLVKRAKDFGILCYKFTSPARRAVPDRILLAPGGETCFVECKAPGKKPTEAQASLHRLFRTQGHRVEVIDSKEGVDYLMEILSE